MSRMIDLSRESRDTRFERFAERDRLLPSQFKETLKEQWRHASHRHSKVLVHIFEKNLGRDYYVTGWDGANTVGALTNSGFRNVPLAEVAEGSPCIDRGWNENTLLQAVLENHDATTPTRSASTMRHATPFDSVFAGYKNLLQEEHEYKEGRRHVGESKKFRKPQQTVPKWTVALRETLEGTEWRAFKDSRHIPADMLSVETVYAVDEAGAIEQAQELCEKRAPASKATGVTPFFRNAHGIKTMEDIFGASTKEDEMSLRDRIMSEGMKSIVQKIPATEVSSWKANFRRNKGVKGPGGFKFGQKFKHNGKNWLIHDFDADAEAPGGFTLSLVSPDFKEHLRWVKVG